VPWSKNIFAFLPTKSAEFEVKNRRGISKAEYLLLGAIKDVRTKSQKIDPLPPCPHWLNPLSPFARAETP